MSCCTFFGHGDCPGDIRPMLRETLTRLIEEEGVDRFYVGDRGDFDRMVRGVLRELARQYAHIHYAVVLAYMPQTPREYEDYSDTMLPEGVETAPRRFAISWRNRWMIRQSELVVTYITHPWGGAAQFAEEAARRGKRIIPLGTM